MANIPPRGKITIEIEYLQQVQVKDLEFSITLPLVVEDRYIAGVKIKTNKQVGNTSNTHLVPDAAKITPLNDNNAKRLVSINVALNAGFEIKKISTPNHQSNITKNGNIQQIIINNTKANKDFVLRWKPNNINPTSALFSEKINGDTYFMLMMLPQQKITHNSKRNITFIVDSSGSMSGTSMRYAKKSLLLAIKNLNKNDKFNIIDFDDKIDSLFLAPQLADSTHKILALDFIKNMEADGGTEIYNAIDYFLKYNTEIDKTYLQ